MLNGNDDEFVIRSGKFFEAYTKYSKGPLLCQLLNVQGQLDNTEMFVMIVFHNEAVYRLNFPMNARDMIAFMKFDNTHTFTPITVDTVRITWSK